MSELYPMRLQKFLAASGLGSRRTCEKFISDGDVSVNGVVITQQGTKVAEGDTVCYRDKIVEPKVKRYFILNKPSGYLSSNFDPHHDDYARDLITEPEKDSLFHVGRLDLYSTGMIIYTNDGAFAQQISHPKYELDKEYLVTLRQQIKQDDFIQVLKYGLASDGEILKIKEVKFLDDHSMNMILKEGKNREIRRICYHYEYTIDKLHRIRIGEVLIGNLPEGSYREMTEDEIASILGKKENV